MLNLRGNAGDTGGRATPMGNYNYDYVVGWMERACKRSIPGRTITSCWPRVISHGSASPKFYLATVDFIVADASRAPERKW